ncbi:dienelactone hydrolase family protein [candidate division KSB1 bacterium]|nr:dienelactone hydrolase family protein [candidate division KSB1 bacterium]
MKQNTRRRFLIVILTLSALIVSTIIGFRKYLNADYRDVFIKNKGQIVRTELRFRAEDSTFNNYDLTIIDSNNLTIQCMVRVPKDSTQKYPALLVMNGFDTGRHVIELFNSIEKAVLISFDWPYEGKRKFRGADIGPFLPKIRSAIIRAVSVVLEVIDYLQTRADVDQEKIFVVGASFGAPFAVDAAAVDERIKAVILLYGGGDISLLIQSSSTKQVKTAWGRKLLGEFVAALLAPVEPMKYVEYISPRPLLMINGKSDQSIFGKSAELLFEKAEDPKDMVWLETRHVKPKMSDLTATLEQMMKKWLIEKGLL